jgi:hypothetical protein
MQAAPARPHPTVSTRRFDRRRLQITPQPAGDRVLVRFRLPLLLLVAVTVYGVVATGSCRREQRPQGAADRRRLIGYTHLTLGRGKKLRPVSGVCSRTVHKRHNRSARSPPHHRPTLARSDRTPRNGTHWTF